MPDPHAPYFHTAFGLNLASALELPGLPPASGKTDVVLRVGSVPKSLPEPVLRRAFYQARRSTWLMTADRIAGGRILVREGREIIVERTGSSQDRLLHSLLTGPCLGALLLQRGVVSLHASAVATDRGAIVLAGGIGTGKSALTLALLRRGYRLLADDLTAVRVDDGAGPQVLPGFPGLKLWADTCKWFGIDTQDLMRVRGELERFHVPVDDAFCSSSQPLLAAYILMPGGAGESALEPLDGVARMTDLQAHLYKVAFTEAQRNWPWLFGRLTAIVRHTPVRLVRRSKEGFRVDELAGLIAADAAA